MRFCDCRTRCPCYRLFLGLGSSGLQWAALLRVCLRSNAGAPSATLLKQTSEGTGCLGVGLAQEQMGPRLWHQGPPRAPQQGAPPWASWERFQSSSEETQQESFGPLVPHFPVLEGLTLCLVPLTLRTAGRQRTRGPPQKGVTSPVLPARGQAKVSVFSLSPYVRQPHAKLPLCVTPGSTVTIAVAKWTGFSLWTLPRAKLPMCLPS